MLSFNEKNTDANERMKKNQRTKESLPSSACVLRTTKKKITEHNKLTVTWQ